MAAFLPSRSKIHSPPVPVVAVVWMIGGGDPLRIVVRMSVVSGQP
jgi:1,4-dihydroxy-2-naphthoyl-CoA synthase